jgi:hypothetical protein
MRNPFASFAWAVQIMLAKRTVARVTPSFDVDLGEFDSSDYQSIIPSLQEVERQLQRVPLDKRGMRWIHLPDTTWFSGERRYDIPFDDFVARVPIDHVGQFYRDAIGVTTVVAARDNAGRTVEQGVRVAALPQPNYAAFLLKPRLDVYKLEKVDYADDEQRVWMRTVHSPNRSAICDDGYMTFRRDGDGTVVVFLACQNFPLPPLMALSRIDRWAWFKKLVTESAYRRFCLTMWRNIEHRYDGRDFHVGRTKPRELARI